MKGCMYLRTYFNRNHNDSLFFIAITTSLSGRSRCTTIIYWLPSRCVLIRWTVLSLSVNNVNEVILANKFKTTCLFLFMVSSLQR